MKAKAVNGQLHGRPFIYLLDSDSTGCVFNKQSPLFGTQTTTTLYNTVQTTSQGTHSSNQVVFVNNIQLPEFVNQRHINGALGHVFNSPNSPYNIILGKDFLQVIGIKMGFELDTILWLDTQVDMKNIKQILCKSLKWNNTLILISRTNISVTTKWIIMPATY